MVKSKESESSKERANKAPKKRAAKLSGDVAPKAEKKEKLAKTAASGKGGAPAKPRPKLIERTFFAKPGQFPTQWKLVDVSGLPLGRVSSYIAQILMGKLNPAFYRGTNTGDAVVVINAEKVVLTGNKLEEKVYQYHTGYPGGIKTLYAKNVLAKNPDRVIKSAVYGMLTRGHGHMARQWFKNLHVYAGPNHPHKAQKPLPVNLPHLGQTERT